MRAMFKENRRIAFSPNGRSLVSAFNDELARMWNIQDGSSKIMPVAERTSYFISVAICPDGRYVAGNFDSSESMWIWDSRSPVKLVAKWLRHEYGVRFLEFYARQ